MTFIKILLQKYDLEAYPEKDQWHLEQDTYKVRTQESDSWLDIENLKFWILYLDAHRHACYNNNR